MDTRQLEAAAQGLEESGFFQFPLTRQRMEALTDVPVLGATTFGMGCRPAPSLIVDTLAMFGRQAYFARALGVRKIIVVLAEGLTATCAPAAPERVSATATLHRRLAGKFSALVPDLEIVTISDLELRETSCYRRFLGERERLGDSVQANRYSFLQDVLFLTVAELHGVIAKGGWTRWASDAELEASGVINRLEGDKGADEAAFDWKSRLVHALLGVRLLAYFYGRPARAFSTECSFRAPYLDLRFDTLTSALGGDHGRIPLCPGLNVRELLPDLMTPEGRHNDHRRKWLEARVDAVEGAAEIVQLLAAVAPGAFPQPIDGGVEEASSRLAAWQKRLDAAAAGPGGKRGKAYEGIARERQGLVASYGTAKWRSISPVLQAIVDHFADTCA